VAPRRRGRWIAEQDFTMMEIKSKDMNSKDVVLSILSLSETACRKGSNLILHSPFIFKGRGEEEVGLRPDLTRCRQHTFKWENWGKRGMEGGTQPKEQVVGNKKRRHGTGENSRSPCILQGLSLRFTSPKKSHSGTQRRMDRAFQVPHEKRNT